MGRPPRVQGLRRHAPGGKSVEAARAVCASKLAIRLRSVVSVPSSACEPSTMRRRRLHVDALNNARGHSRRVTRSQSVLGQEAMSGGLIVDGHVLGDLRAAVAELGARTARLDDGHANAEGIDFLRDGLHKPFNPTSSRRLSASACQRPRRSPTRQMEGRADTPRGRPRKIVGRA